MRKYITNKTEEDKIIIGRVLAPDERWEIPPSLWTKAIRNTEIIPLVETGDLEVDNGSTILTGTTAVDWINNLYDLSEINIKKIFTFQIHKTKNGNNLMSNGTWFDAWPSAIASGCYSGFGASTQPMVIPFNCVLKSVLVNFRKANFDWRTTVGHIFIELGFYTHDYNGADDFCRLGMDLSGSYSGNTTGDGTHKFDISSFTARVGSNSFTKNSIIGVQLRKDTNKAGQIQSLSDPILLLTFEESI